MKALGPAMQRAWAALWVWAQIVRAGLRRRPSGPDYHLPETATPVAGIDYPLPEVPAEVADRLDAVTAELLERSRRSTARRARRHAQRRRVLALAGATLMSLLLVAGASALIGGSTGVPEVDRLLGIHAANAPDDVDDGTGPPGRAGVAPRGDGDGVSVAAGEGGDRLVVATYVSRTDRVCSVATGAGDGSAAGGLFACGPSQEVARALARSPVVLAASDPSAGAFVAYLADEVRTFEVEGPAGSQTVKISEPWDPGVAGIPPIRVALAVASGGGSDGGPETGDAYKITARLDDGRTISIRP